MAKYASAKAAEVAPKAPVTLIARCAMANIWTKTRTRCQPSSATKRLK
jgi:hypothetical protein